MLLLVLLCTIAVARPTEQALKSKMKLWSVIGWYMNDVLTHGLSDNPAMVDGFTNTTKCGKFADVITVSSIVMYVHDKFTMRFDVHDMLRAAAMNRYNYDSALQCLKWLTGNGAYDDSVEILFPLDWHKEMLEKHKYTNYQEAIDHTLVDLWLEFLKFHDNLARLQTQALLGVSSAEYLLVIDVASTYFTGNVTLNVVKSYIQGLGVSQHEIASLSLKSLMAVRLSYNSELMQLLVMQMTPVQ